MFFQKRNFIFLFICLSKNIVAQQKISYQLKIYPSINGTKLTNVHNINEDKYGFLWVSTQEGLHRFSGTNVDSYNTYYPDKRQILSSDARSFYTPSKSNEAWLITSAGGLNSVDIITGNITSTTNLSKLGVTFLTQLIDAGDSIFLFDRIGILIYDKASKKVNRVISKNFGSIDIDFAMKYKKDLILFVKNRGIIQYNLENDKVIQQISNENTRYFKAEMLKEKWIIASSKGLKLLEIYNGRINLNETYFNFLPENVNSNIADLCIDKDQNVWFSNETKLFYYTKNHEYFEVQCKNEATELEWLNAVYTLFCDSSNNIWLGCQKGLAMIKNIKSPFTIINTSSINYNFLNHTYFIFPKNDSTILACAENGLFEVNNKKEKLSISKNLITHDYIFTDPFGKTVITNANGIFISVVNSLIPISKLYKEFEKYDKFRINSSAKLNDSCIAFGTESDQGVLIWNYKNHVVINYDKSTLPISLKEGVTNNIFSISQNKIAILGDANFGILDYQEKKYTPIYFTNDDGKLYSLFFDLCKVKDKYYLACYGQGVLVLDNNFKVVDKITTATGLSNNGTYKVLPWKDSLIFITTNNGLNVYNASTKKIKQYYKTDGLHNDIFEETSGNVYNDKIFCGGEGGFTIVNPNLLNENTIAPKIYFGKLKLENTEAQVSDTLNLYATKYSIPNNTIQTTINFSAINYSNPERTTFKYRILEQSEEWIDLGTQSFVTLIGLSPGKYHLQVKAANEDGVWSEAKELVLDFLPKWYQTWWFKLLVALSIASLVYAFYKYRIKQIEKQHLIRKNIATDLHDDLGSTLNSVKVFTNLAISGVNQNESLQQIKDNLAEATLGLRDMIWVLDDGLDTVDELATRIKQYVIPVANAANINVEVKTTTEINSIKLTKEEKRNLFLICKEAINNSIKYSGANNIDVTIKPQNKKIAITIIDNGKGFNMEKAKKGYGLKNMQYRAEQVKFKVGVESVEGKGCTISVLPI